MKNEIKVGTLVRFCATCSVDVADTGIVVEVKQTPPAYPYKVFWLLHGGCSQHTEAELNNDVVKVLSY